MMLKKILLILAQATIIILAYIFCARPFQLKWGATLNEVSKSMVGDERIGENPSFFATRAITINDIPEKIWPWIIQMGYERAGFYGYDILENLGSKMGIYSANKILPEFQNFKTGDDLPISPVAHLSFYAIEPYKYLTWSEDKGKYPGAFIWALYPINESQTRLVSRIGWSYHWSEPSLILLDLFTEFADHIAVREILKGIKGHVEGNVDSFAKQTLNFFIYLIVFMIFIFIQSVLILLPLSLSKWVMGTVSGLVWLMTWYAPIPIWVGAIASCACILFFFKEPRFLKINRLV